MYKLIVFITLVVTLIVSVLLNRGSSNAAYKAGYDKGYYDASVSDAKAYGYGSEDRISYCIQGANSSTSICILESGLRAPCDGSVVQCLHGTVSFEGVSIGKAPEPTAGQVWVIPAK